MIVNNVILITGSSEWYEQAQWTRLMSVAEYDAVMTAWISPISKKEEVEALCSELNLHSQEFFVKDYIEPRGEKEWDLRRADSRIWMKKLQLHKQESKKDVLCDNGCQESNKSEIEDIQISISALKDSITSLEEQKVRLNEEVKRGRTKTLKIYSLAERAGDGEDWLTTRPPPMRMLLKRPDGKGYMPRGIVGLVVGVGGSGKTRILLQLALNIASGTRFLDLFDVATESGYGKVFVGLGEEPNDNIRRRLRNIVSHYNPISEDFTDQQRHSKVDLNGVRDRLFLHSFRGQNVRLIDERGETLPAYTALLNELKRQEGEEGFDLIILDPISRFQGTTTETDNNNATDLISLLERMTEELKGNPTVLICHHMSKGADWTNQEAARGSSGLSSGARWQMNVATPLCEKSEGNSKGPKKFVKGFLGLDLVKHNDVRHLDHPILLKFSEDGVLVPATRDECTAKDVQLNKFFPDSLMRESQGQVKTRDTSYLNV